MSTQSVALATTQDNVMSFDLLVRQADILATSKIIPRAYQNRSTDVIAAGLAGFAFGWDVMTSLRNYHVIEGTASMRPEAMLGLVRRCGHSVMLEVVDARINNENCRLARAVGVRRDNGDKHTAEFTTLDAKKAGLAHKNNWKQYEDSMLTWRAVSALCRVLFPDVVLGAGYVPEELGVPVNESGDVVETIVFDGLTSAAAKTELLEVCAGDKEKAKAIWGDRGNKSITREELDELFNVALEMEDEIIVCEAKEEPARNTEEVIEVDSLEDFFTKPNTKKSIEELINKTTTNSQQEK